MAGLPTNQRDQIMLLLAVVGIAGAALFWAYPYGTKATELDAIEARVVTLDSLNQLARASADPATLQQLRDDAKKLEANLDLMRTLIPTGNEVPALLEQMLGAARRSGLEITNFTPSGTVTGDSFDTIKYRLSMQGNYHDIGTLLTNVGSLRRIIVPVNLSLTPSSSREAREGPVDERLLTAAFEIQTYVAKSTAEDK